LFHAIFASRIKSLEEHGEMPRLSTAVLYPEISFVLAEAMKLASIALARGKFRGVKPN
jgi:hypothetical protein